MKTLFVLLAVSLVLQPAAHARRQSVKTDAETFLRKTADGLSRLRSCESKIWPEGFLSKINVVLARPAANQAWLNLTDGTTHAIDLAKVPDELKNGAFGFHAFEGRDAVGINIDRGIEDYGDETTSFVGFIIHEAFHSAAQRSWNEAAGSGSRASLYPAPWEPRHYRRQTSLSLLAAIRDPENAALHLANASHWNAKYKSANADEYQRMGRTDIYEGSAQYVQTVAEAIIDNGCGADENTLTASYIKSLAASEKSFLQSERGVVADSESYILGMISGLLLRRMGASGWEKSVTQAQRPVDLLLNGIVPVDPGPSAEEAKLIALVDKANAKTGVFVEPFLSKLVSKDYARVMSSRSDMTGSFNTYGFVILAKDPRSELVLEMKARFKSREDITDYEIASETTIQNGLGPCKARGAYFLVPKTAIEKIPGGFKLNSPTAKGTVAGIEKTDETGFAWICPKE